MDIIESLQGAETDPLSVKKGSVCNCSPRDDGGQPLVDGDYERWTIHAVFHPSDDTSSDISEDIVVAKAEEGLVVLGDPPPSGLPSSAINVLTEFQAGMALYHCSINISTPSRVFVVNYMTEPNPLCFRGSLTPRRPSHLTCRIYA